jgi:hypothetical protein
MARGWESKSVEEQVADNAGTPVTTGRPEKMDEEQAMRMRQRQSLEMQRERILSERTSSPVRRSALLAALKEIEARLQDL